MNRAERAVQREFADEELIFKVGFEELSAEREDGEGDGKVEMRAVF